MKLTNELTRNYVRSRRSDHKKIGICIKITGKMSRWLADNDLSPTSIFNEACKELGYKEKEE